MASTTIGVYNSEVDLQLGQAPTEVQDPKVQEALAELYNAVQILANKVQELSDLHP